MHTPGHAVVNLATLGCIVGHEGAVLAGAILPDLPIVILYLYERARGTPEQTIWAVCYQNRYWLAIQQGHDGVWFAVSKGGIALVVSIGLLPLLHYGFWIMQRSFVDSLSDPLTGLTNRRGLDEVARRMVADGGSTGPLSALWIDLDGFKTVNDTHGHLAGDAVLVSTAQCIRDCVATAAVVARLGGEEFLVVDVLARPEASTVAERIRNAIATTTEPSVTASVGVATAESGTDGHLDGLLERADDAMYEAKRLGGDQVVAAI